ncbi:uncharacterized protein EDB91DRAFT_575861 [Suillus paluster]|uniref:uncharacterized protein n=1 Tax=Suillus paluster TaxID=48578 RepID=UPI001B87A466|nr:uncharacterized protein EDB91DRAFT_575861 [Suillus paluster]KAG1734897.1 hypothetical protein EDB91DRAFT_575861 [Suillus paluster]
MNTSYINNTYYINVTGVSEETLFQIYCLNPPSTSCYEPCPNLDVTGIGQQVALGVAATVFVIHNTGEVRLAYYSYLANIYSLLISAVISMSNMQLTRNDAVFVVVAIANPGTLYLWVIAFMTLAKHPPRRIKDKIAHHYEWKFFICLSVASFVIWIIMLGLLTHPPNGVRFSQQDCSHEYGQTEIINLIWSGIFFLRAVVAISLLLVVPRAWEQRNQSSNNYDLDDGQRTGRSQPNNVDLSLPEDVQVCTIRSLSPFFR